MSDWQWLEPPRPPSKPQEVDTKAQAFYAEAASRGSSSHGFSFPIGAVDLCVFRDGEHVYAGRACPHGPGAPEDQLGSQPPTGWTVQSERHQP